MQNRILLELNKYLPSGRHIKYTLYVCGEDKYSVCAEFVGEDSDDRELAEDICRDRKSAEDFIYLLSRNEVEPCHLMDIVYDMLPI